MNKNEENTIRNNTDDHRFELMIDGKLSMTEYVMPTESIIIFSHTEVPEELEDRGIASRLAKVALEFAKGKGLVVIPLCPFVKGYIHRHPGYQPLVKYARFGLKSESLRGAFCRSNLMIFKRLLR